METLIDALARYANENLIFRLQQDTALETRAACYRVEQLTSQLESLGPEAEKWMGELRAELATIDVNNEQAILRAGISIGLELGRL